MLRERAEKKGIEIDEVFRNENGITMQFMLMNELVSEEKCGLRGASKLFVYMSDMFKNNKASFDKILEEANPLAVKKNTKEQFYTWMENKVSEKQLSDTCVMCDEIEQYCIDKNISSYGLFDTTNPENVNKISRVLTSDKKFREDNKISLGKIRGILYYYVRFLKEGKINKLDGVEETNTNDENTSSGEHTTGGKEKELKDSICSKVENDEEYEKYLIILRDDYENGFRIKSAIDRGRFKVFYEEHFNQKILLSDEQLIQTLMKIGTLREERIYAKQGNEQQELLEIVYNDVMSIFSMGASCVYEEAVYVRYSDLITEKLQIYNAEEFGNLILEMSHGLLRRKHTFFCLQAGQSDLKNDVLNIVRKSLSPINYDSISQIMWYVPLDKIKQVMVNIKSIAYVAPETYFYALNLPVNEEELLKIKQIIFSELETKKYITDVELRSFIEDKCPSVAINTEGFTTYGLRNCLAYIFSDTFSFNGPIISKPESQLGMADVFAEYCKNREQVTIEELKNLADDMETVIYWDSVRDVTVRISDKVFLRNDRIKFDIEAIDSILNQISDKNYIPIKEIGLFLHYPILQVPWNGYILESFLNKYSKRFKLLHASFSASGYFGAMVRRKSEINDYRSLIVDVLTHSNQWEDKKSALEVLVEAGYQQRRSYSGIDGVMIEAKAAKEELKKTMK